MILAAALAALTAGTADTYAQTTLAGGDITVKKSTVRKDDRNVNVNLDLDLSRTRITGNKGLILTPMLVNGSDTARLSSIEVLGRKRYIYYQRNGKTSTKNPALVERRHNGDPQTATYTASVPYQRWMNASQLIVAEGECGCDQTLLSENVFEPVHNVDIGGGQPMHFAYVQPKPEAVKHRAEEGSARLNFVVNKYDIRPTFGNNTAELDKIRRTIDLVRNDADVQLTGIELHGYASPDGSFKNNESLAANRTEALRKYLKNYYPAIDDRVFTTKSTAEDWDGVRHYLESCSLSDRDALLKIANSSELTPDQKDRTFAAKHGASYRTILNDVYPPLRRTDYRVTYNVRNFNLEEARRIIKERPQKLSLQEMYRVANSYKAGSDDFNQVFDVAVRMFPDDELANLNAANVALSRGDKVSAERFLSKAGNSAEADNARGVLAAKNEDYAAARRYFSAAASKGLNEAKANLAELDNAGE